MSRSIAVAIVVLALTAGGSTSASAWGWWDRCDYTCYGPPYGNTEPPDLYVYDHQVGPTWTGNGWAYLPIGRYRPGPPEYAPVPPPGYGDEDYRERPRHRRVHRHRWW